MSVTAPNIIFIPPRCFDPYDEVLARKNDDDEVAYIRKDIVDAALPVLIQLKNLVSIEYGFDQPIIDRALAAIASLGGEA